MTDLAKSLFRCSWALSLFGASRAVDLLTRRSGAVADLEAVRYTAEGQLDGTFRPLFNTGDRLQRGIVDLAADLLSGAWGTRRG